MNNGPVMITLDSKGGYTNGKRASCDTGLSKFREINWLFSAYIVSMLAWWVVFLMYFSKSSFAQVAGNNICKNSKFTLADGTQNPAGSCSSTVNGEIPDINHMVSALIVRPKNGETIQAEEPFVIAVSLRNLKAGFFTDPATQYLSSP